MGQCKATTGSGQRCRRRATEDGLCTVHRHHTNGRPTSYTPELGGELVLLIESGSTIETAARAAGIPSKTIRAWLTKGGKGQEPYAKFRADVDRARAQVKVQNLRTVTAAASDDWRAGAYLLDRHSRDEDSDEELLDTAAIVKAAAGRARTEAEATLREFGESVELSRGAIDRYASAAGMCAALEAQWEHCGSPALALGGATGMAKVPHPLIGQIAAARRETAQLGEQLGLDPVSRAKLVRARPGAGRPPGAASAADRVAAPPRRQLRAVN